MPENQSHAGAAVETFSVSPRFGSPPDPALLREQFGRAISGSLPLADREGQRPVQSEGSGNAKKGPVPKARPKVCLERMPERQGLCRTAANVVQVRRSVLRVHSLHLLSPGFLRIVTEKKADALQERFGCDGCRR